MTLYKSIPRRLWSLLTAPQSSITDVLERRRAQTLSGLTLALAFALLPFILVRLIRGEPPSPAPLITLALSLVGYALSRTRWPNIGALVLVFGVGAMNFILLAGTTDPEVTTQITAFLILPILISALVLRWQITVVLAGSIMVGFTLFALVAPWMDRDQMILPVAVVAVLGVLTGVVAVMRERDLDTIRRQAREAYRADALEAEVDKRIIDITAISEVGRVITGARDLDTLLKQVVSLIVERFDFYHAQVFLVDDSAKNAVLKASTGTAGQELLTRGHRLPIGSQSVIGQVTARGESVIASDTDVDPIHRRNELLPHTRSELALPLRVSGKVIGALDVQSVNPDAFDQTDVSVFQTMADQLAIAIENARLFGQAERDLDDIRALNRQLTGESWRRFLTGRSQASPLGYAASADGVRPIKSGEVTDGEDGDPGALSLPLTVRGETIGVLDLKSRTGQPPDEDTRVMLEAVAERVAQALDSTRLGEQAQRQAEREQILGQLSAELQATTDLDAVLKIVAREASRALGAQRGFVHLTMEYGGGHETAEKDAS